MQYECTLSLSMLNSYELEGTRICCRRIVAALSKTVFRMEGMFCVLLWCLGTSLLSGFVFVDL